MGLSSTSLLAGVSLNNDVYSQYINRIGIVDPCAIPYKDLWGFLEKKYVDLFEAYDIYEFGGPTWY